jgi:hypothetical protein
MHYLDTPADIEQELREDNNHPSSLGGHEVVKTCVRWRYHTGFRQSQDNLLFGRHFKISEIFLIPVNVLDELDGELGCAAG